MTEHRHVELMQLHDEELELDAELTEEELAVLEGLDQVGDAVRLWAAERGEGVSVTEDVMAALDAEEPPADSAPRHRWGVVAAAMAMAAAAALALNLAKHSEPEPQLALTLPPPPQVQPLPPEQMPAVAESEPSSPAAIESIDFGGQNGAIFMVPAGTETTPVVWLTDDATEGGDRVEPL